MDITSKNTGRSECYPGLISWRLSLDANRYWLKIHWRTDVLTESVVALYRFADKFDRLAEDARLTLRLQVQFARREVAPNIIIK